MNTMQDWFDAYGVSHQNPTNKAVHWICVPLIFYSLLGVLSLIPLGAVEQSIASGWRPYLHVGTLLVLVALFFFVRLSLSITLGMILVSAGMLWLVKLTHIAFGDGAWLVFVSVFVAAWIGQFIGHKIEGAKPSFLDDLKFLLIGPAWLLHFIYKKLHIPY